MSISGPMNKLPRIVSTRPGPSAVAVLVPAIALLLSISSSVEPAGAGDSAPAKVDVKIVVTPPDRPVPAGSHGEASVLLSPPRGIEINRFPPVRLTLQESEGIHLDSKEVRQGSAEPIDDPEDFHFKKLEPLTVGFTVDPTTPAGAARLTGRIKFVYCVASSGYCAPVTRDVAIDLAVAPPRAN